jgi:hypothetical protein
MLVLMLFVFRMLSGGGRGSIGGLGSALLLVIVSIGEGKQGKAKG